MEWVPAIGFILGGYLVGAIPFGLLVGFVRGIDVRTRGSGNIGATNVGRVLGRPFGFLVFGLDLLKGLGPVLLTGRWLAGEGQGLSAGQFCIWGAVATACILGHVFPVYLKFKGGKGVATSLGILLGIYPYFTIPGLLAFGLWITLTGTTRYVSVGSVGAAVAFPILFAVFARLRQETWGTAEQLWPLYFFAILMAALVVYRHRTNLQRLRAGTESKIGSSGGKAN